MHIEMTDIYKAFGQNQVLSGVSFELLEGEVHALMGENGAGKSTLMNVLTGLHKLDSGTIKINGHDKYFSDPNEAEKHGIAFIHQELNIWPEMSVLENLFIGKELSTTLGFLNNKKMKALANTQLKKLGVSLSLEKEAGLLGSGQQQMIEIAKALMIDAKVIIMDEPTAALTEKEVTKLFQVIRSLKKNGVSIIYISHRMEEIFTICDRITVMRDGKTVDTKKMSNTDFHEVVKKMVGRELTERYPERHPKLGDIVFEVKNASKKRVFENINFHVHAGEIVGVSGLMGAGRTELMRAIFGLNPLDSGEILINGKQANIKKPSDAVQKKIGFITENRKDEGLILDTSIRENIALPNLVSFSPNGWIDQKREQEFVDLLIKRLTIKTNSCDIQARSLSGGNQQKVVIAKWIGIGPKVLILDEPTRGVDVGAKREIYQLMNELTDRGVAIIMVSSELPEILGMSDRILVIHEGKLSGELLRKDATQERIMTLATGGQSYENTNG
ncbi:sugar ABC transporter ATP-binding protein [Bacillus changyiensis]|uniref:sugar ABC transporter ATP-binding protein n=1 Tax=Bacillus changyiensis TaxID=3004103 RepID=UPI0022E405F6|nr:sugar ABC transporter ATP-binding protein [Bacillus changyiensis]MDA1476618.1 sugar ABC transporter ATP-binding protein [Bacillus changyiensis]